jgi:hypothetical protein
VLARVVAKVVQQLAKKLLQPKKALVQVFQYKPNSKALTAKPGAVVV